MNLLVVSLLSVLIALVVVNGILVWRADKQARRDSDRQSCIERVQATAMIALLAPSSQVDAQGRVRAIQALGAKLDRC